MSIFRVTAEAPTPVTNGVQTLFTLSKSYIAGTLVIFKRGTRLEPEEFTETSPSSGTFTVTVAPDADEHLIVDYQTTIGDVDVTDTWFLSRIINMISLLDANAPIIKDVDRPIIYLKAIGSRIRVYSGVDLSAASAVNLRVQKSSGSIVLWEGQIDSENPYYMIYTLVDGDLDLEGIYSISLEVTVNSLVSKGTVEEFEVRKQYVGLSTDV